MLFPVAIMVLLAGSAFQKPVLGSGNFTYDEDAFCRHDPSVEAFAASFFSAMVVEIGYDLVATVQAKGSDAAKSEYGIVLDILQREGMCNPEWVAYTASHGFLSEDVTHLDGYLERTGHSIGRFLVQYGLLDCSNSISRSLDYFTLVRAAFKGLDKQKLATYQRGVVQGLVDLIHEHGLNLEDAISDSGYAFYRQFQSSHQGGCKKSK